MPTQPDSDSDDDFTEAVYASEPAEIADDNDDLGSPGIIGSSPMPLPVEIISRHMADSGLAPAEHDFLGHVGFDAEGSVWALCHHRAQGTLVWLMLPTVFAESRGHA